MATPATAPPGGKKSWVSEHKGVAIGGGVIAVGGIVFFIYEHNKNSSSGNANTPGGIGTTTGGEEFILPSGGGQSSGGGGGGGQGEGGLYNLLQQMEEQINSLSTATQPNSITNGIGVSTPTTPVSPNVTAPTQTVASVPASQVTSQVTNPTPQQLSIISTNASAPAVVAGNSQGQIAEATQAAQQQAANGGQVTENAAQAEANPASAGFVYDGGEWVPLNNPTTASMLK